MRHLIYETAMFFNAEVIHKMILGRHVCQYWNKATCKNITLIKFLEDVQ